MLFGHDINESRMLSGFAPADRALRDMLKDVQAAQGDMGWIYPVSYWYPPVFWQDPARFSQNAATRPQPNASNKYYIRRNKFTDVWAPMAKVQLFERADFYSRPRGGKAPMWNHPSAKPQVALVDGSGKTVSMAAIYAQTSTNAAMNSFSAGTNLNQPAGLWSPSDAELGYYFEFSGPAINSRFEFENLPGRPAYFWSTRGGIRGVDIP
jgi:hypothetical protein